MLTAAIIAEYNPFHNGHALHIAQTRLAGASHVVAIMSGNFTQRGVPAVAEKRVRTEAALRAGADLVLELPVPYAVGSAQRFAFGAVGIVMALECVDMLSFGSESGYLSLIQAAARAIDAPAVRERMGEYLDRGDTFAKARQLAVADLYGDEVADMLAGPNDTLGVEYVRQLMLADSEILPFCMKRVGAGHHDRTSRGEIASASFIRGLWRTRELSVIEAYMPQGAKEALQRGMDAGLAPMDASRLAFPMLAHLRRLSAEQIAQLPDVSEGLENRILAAIRRSTTLEEVYAAAKSKRYTAARIRRILLSAFLGLDASLAQRPTPYIRVLGFNPKGREILAAARGQARLPLSDSLAALEKQGGDCAVFARMEAMATDLYTLGLPKVPPCGYDYTAGSIRV